MVIPDIRQRMTKAFLMSLQEGVCFTSNSIGPDRECDFSGVIAPTSDREAQWEKFKAAGIHQKKFNIFFDRSERDLFLAWAKEQLTHQPQ